MQPIRISSASPTGRFVKIENLYDFTNLNTLQGHWWISENGKTIQEGKLDELNVLPGKAILVNVPFDKPDLIPGSEYFLSVSFSTISPTELVPEQYEIAWEQFKLDYQIPAPSKIDLNSLSDISYNESKKEILIESADFSVTINKETGFLQSYIANKTELLC